jgi:hypothetical protein
MIDIQASLGELSQRVNVTTRYPFDGQKIVIIYDDHRWLLNVLYKIQKDSLLPGPPKLVFFDSHDDAGQNPKKSELLAHIGVENLSDATEKAFSSFVDYDIRTDDGNWLSVACELNLVSDVVVIGNKYSDNIERMNNIYISEDGITHKLLEMSTDLEAELGCRGSLGDRARDVEFREIRSFFNSQYGHRYARVGEMTPFVLDFDLDYFTLDTNEGTMAWTQRIWKNHFDLGKPGATFIHDLIGKAMVITVCREPDYCGGIAGSNYNLQNLDNYFFDGQLGTNLLY